MSYPEGIPLAPGDSLEDNPQGGGPEEDLPTHPNSELLALLNTPGTPRWLIDLVPILLKKDPVDVANVFATMAGILERRLDTFLAAAQANVSFQSYCQGCHSLQDDVLTVEVMGPQGTVKGLYCGRCRTSKAELFKEIDVHEALGASGLPVCTLPEDD